jgi:hypothetical protein
MNFLFHCAFSSLPLSKFEYVHHCLKLDQDIAFAMVAKEQIIRPFIRTVSCSKKKKEIFLLFLIVHYLKNVSFQL